VFALTFTINKNSTDLIQSHQFHHSCCCHFHATFISEPASEAEEVMLFLQANESVSRFPRLFPFFYRSLFFSASQLLFRM